MLKIGSLQINNPVIQAALAGYSDRAMRVLARRFGCELTFSGVILDSSTEYKPLFEKPNYIVKDDEHPIGAQLLGYEPQMMAKAAVNMAEIGYDLIDLNFACPAPKVVKKSRGGALLAEPQTVIEIFKRVKSAVKLPVMLKLRTGFDNSRQSTENFEQIIAQAVENNIDAIIVHGRKVKQFFKGKADWEILARLKQKYPQMTIIGSGDLFEPQDIVNKLKKSKLDGVALARGVIGKPWLFRQVADIMANKPEIYQPDLQMQGRIILEHFAMLKELYDIKKCIWYFRKFLVKYSSSHNSIKKTRIKLVAIQNQDELTEAIKQLYEL